MHLNGLHIESIHIGEGKPSTVASVGRTGIDKSAVPSATVGPLGLSGDTVANTKHHGGPDQAVYVYTRPDYDHWETELDGPLRPGLFGENLTLSDMTSADVDVGDRFVIGTVVLEATSTRIPCNIFEHHLGEPKWVERFRDGRRPGFYCRVVCEGDLKTHDSVEHLPSAGNVSILETQDLYYDLGASSERIRAALDSPIAERTRALLETRLARR